MEFIAFLICYFFGSVPFGFIAGKLLKGIDIRDYGSGNIGATNVLRTLGPIPAVIVFLLDIAKGVGSFYLCRYVFNMPEYLTIIGGLICILGHTFSVFLKFKGGKGIATSLGIIIGINPVIAAIGFGVWIVVVTITRYVSVASIVATLSVLGMIVFWKSQNAHISYQIVTTIAAIFIIVKHRDNFKRLREGTEKKIGQRVEIKK